MTFFRTVIVLQAIGAALTAFLIFLLPIHSAAQEPVEQIATVNADVISRQDLDREMKLVALKLARQGRPVDDTLLKRYEGSIRETLIKRRLLLQQAQSKDIQVKSSQVAKALAEFKAAFKSADAYQSALKDMGFTAEMLESQIRDGLTIKTLIDNEVTHTLSLSDTQIRAYYDDNPSLFQRPEQVKASHILIAVQQGDDENQKAEALAAIQALKVRIDNGENFANLAMEHSACPSKAKGGDLGFFGKEQMVPPFSEAAFALEPGQVSNVVQTRFGYHLIRLTEKEEAQIMAFTDVKEAIATRLRQEQESKKIDAYLEKLKEHADIKRFPL